MKLDSLSLLLFRSLDAIYPRSKKSKRTLRFTRKKRPSVRTSLLSMLENNLSLTKFFKNQKMFHLNQRRKSKRKSLRRKLPHKKAQTCLKSLGQMIKRKNLRVMLWPLQSLLKIRRQPSQKSLELNFQSMSWTYMSIQRCLSVRRLIYSFVSTTISRYSQRTWSMMKRR